MGNEQDNIVKLYREGGWLDQLDEYIGRQVAAARRNIRFDLVAAHFYGVIVGMLIAIIGVAIDHPEILRRP